MTITSRAQDFARSIAARIAEVPVRSQWLSEGGTPTRYAIIDDLLPSEIAREIHGAFDPLHFSQRNSFRERKRTSARFDDLPPILGDITFAFQRPEVVGPLADILGITGMSGDPTLYAGGLSLMGRGDFLNPHIDNSHEATKTKYRRVNLLYYVTPDWRLEDGGNLELWDDRVEQPITIHSRFNRLVIMETNRGSWHSVSPVIVDRMRACVSNYYFSPQSPEGVEYYHVTSFTGRPDQPVRRALGILDNTARNFARRALGMKRESDKGYQAAR